MTNFDTSCPRDNCNGNIRAEIETWGGWQAEFSWIGFECDNAFCAATWDRDGNVTFGGFEIASSSS